MPIGFSFGNYSFPKLGLGFHVLYHIHEGPSVCSATCKSCHPQNTGKSCICSYTDMLLGTLWSYGYPPSYQAGPCRSGNKIPWSSEMITIKITKKLNKHECLSIVTIGTSALDNAVSISYLAFFAWSVSLNHITHAKIGFNGISMLPAVVI